MKGLLFFISWYMSVFHRNVRCHHVFIQLFSGPLDPSQLLLQGRFTFMKNTPMVHHGEQFGDSLSCSRTVGNLDYREVAQNQRPCDGLTTRPGRQIFFKKLAVTFRKQTAEASRRVQESGLQGRILMLAYMRQYHKLFS